jgi:hypothetical protein
MNTTRLLILGLVAVLLVWRGPARAGDEVPDDVRKLLDDYDKEEKAIQKKADEEIKAKKDKLIAELKKLQDAYCRATKLEEAILVRNRIRDLKGISARTILQDPGHLVSYRAQVGKTLYFEVTGSTNGTIWGTDLYTDDSTLAMAAVHAGILKDGQKGLVKVTLVKHEAGYDGTTRNGVTSNGYDKWPGNSYQLEAVKD